MHGSKHRAQCVFGSQGRTQRAPLSLLFVCKSDLTESVIDSSETVLLKQYSAHFLSSLLLYDDDDDDVESIKKVPVPFLGRREWQGAPQFTYGRGLWYVPREATSSLSQRHKIWPVCDLSTSVIAAPQVMKNTSWRQEQLGLAHQGAGRRKSWETLGEPQLLGELCQPHQEEQMNQWVTWLSKSPPFLALTTGRHPRRVFARQGLTWCGATMLVIEGHAPPSEVVRPLPPTLEIKKQ